jgi:hypothetical protein
MSNPFLRKDAHISTSQVRTRVISFAQTFSANGCVPDMALRLVDVLFENALGEKMAPRVPVSPGALKRNAQGYGHVCKIAKCASQGYL